MDQARQNFEKLLWKFNMKILREKTASIHESVKITKRTKRSKRMKHIKHMYPARRVRAI